MTNTKFIRSRELYQTPEMTALELMSDANLLQTGSYGDPGKAGADGSVLREEDF